MSPSLGRQRPLGGAPRLPRTAGHRAGADTVRAWWKQRRASITTLTLFAFSSDNWRRPRDEVAALMSLLRRYLQASSRASSTMMCDHRDRARDRSPTASATPSGRRATLSAAAPPFADRDRLLGRDAIASAAAGCASSGRPRARVLPSAGRRRSPRR